MKNRYYHFECENDFVLNDLLQFKCYLNPKECCF